MISLVLIESILQAAIAGLLIGSVYGLMCVGLGLIFGLMRVINFAQGEFLMLGMYVTFFFCTTLGLSGALGPVVGSLVSGVVMFGLGMLIHKTLLVKSTGIRVVGTEGEGHYPQLILTLGISLVVANGALILFGNVSRTVRTPFSATAWDLAIGNDFMLFFNKARVLALVVSILVAVAVYLFVQRTRLGKSLRAAADNAAAATYMGIDVERAHRISFGLGAAVTAVAGGLIASYYPFQPYIGLDFVVIMYAGVVLGGLGSMIGAFWGGLTIGLIQQMSTLFLPLQLQNAMIFVVFLLIILFRPQGLFGKNVERV
jgi:branched-chain amino acid transport system permease protein